LPLAELLAGASFPFSFSLAGAALSGVGAAAGPAGGGATAANGANVAARLRALFSVVLQAFELPRS
jgi:hypothetical protein